MEMIVLERIYASLFLALLGIGSVVLSFGYHLGDALEPGAGYFPSIVGTLLAVLALLDAFREFRARRQWQDLGRWPVRALSVLIGALIAFALLIGGIRSLGLPGAGLLPATFVLVLIASRANAEMPWRHSLVLAAILTAISWLAFAKVLGMAVPLWPWSY